MNLPYLLALSSIFLSISPLKASVHCFLSLVLDSRPPGRTNNLTAVIWSPSSEPPLGRYARGEGRSRDHPEDGEARAVGTWGGLGGQDTIQACGTFCFRVKITAYRAKMDFLVGLTWSAAKEIPALRFPEEPCQVPGHRGRLVSFLVPM